MRLCCVFCSSSSRNERGDNEAINYGIKFSRYETTGLNVEQCHAAASENDFHKSAWCRKMTELGTINNRNATLFRFRQFCFFFHSSSSDRDFNFIHTNLFHMRDEFSHWYEPILFPVFWINSIEEGIAGYQRVPIKRAKRLHFPRSFVRRRIAFGIYKPK